MQRLGFENSATPPVVSPVLRLALAILLAGALLPRPAFAAESYCPNSAHIRPVKTPADLAQAVAKAFAIDEVAASRASFVRCDGSKLLGCYVGANLVCDKAERRRVLLGASAWCRDNPDSENIPMVATGHATVYAWSCKGRRAIAGRRLVSVDRNGYIAENWRDIP